MFDVKDLSVDEFRAWVKRGPEFETWLAGDPLACPVSKFIEDVLECKGMKGHRVFVSSKYVYVIVMVPHPNGGMDLKVEAILGAPQWVAAFVRHLDNLYHGRPVKAAEVLRVLKDLGYTAPGPNKSRRFEFEEEEP
jgi:hypothetical protein